MASKPSPVALIVGEAIGKALILAHRALRNGSTDEERHMAFLSVTAAIQALNPDFDPSSTRLDRDKQE